jgi:hypothetical protein
MLFLALYGLQLVLQSETKYFSQGSIIADSREVATGLMVITSGHVGVELPMDSDEADEENRAPSGKTLLYVFSRGSAPPPPLIAPPTLPIAKPFCCNSLELRQGLYRGQLHCGGQTVGWDVWC